MLGSMMTIYTKLVIDFWWGEDELKRKVHWENWDTLSSPKDLGEWGSKIVSL
jgi:hypothetical protein